MSLKPDPIQPVPEETARIAHAAFRKGNPLLRLRDELGAIFADADFADLFPKLGQPALPPWRLALVTILQFREDLPDRRAAEAVRARIGWKYLFLSASEIIFSNSSLCLPSNITLASIQSSSTFCASLVVIALSSFRRLTLRNLSFISMTFSS